MRDIDNQLFVLDNVVMVGNGFKTTNGITTTEPAIVVSVVRKVPVDQLKKSQVIPSGIRGVATDVIEVGMVHAQSTERMRPAPPGVSIGHSDVTAGTFGCVVRKNNDLFILSNNHVLANSNGGSQGDSILQPGSHDGGTLPNDLIGTLEEFVPIDFGVGIPTCPIGGLVEAVLNGVARGLGSHHRLQLIKQTPGENQVDCAIARPTSPDVIAKEILEVGSPTGVSTAILGTQVQKYGRTTGFTENQITQVDVTVSVNYGGGRFAVFTNQLVAGAMSQAGDSGSAVLDQEKRVVGLLFAGSDSVTIINPIQAVLDGLGVEVVI